MFEDLKNMQFQTVGTKFDSEEERIKLIATKLHSLSWKGKLNQGWQDGYIYEKDENGFDNWDGKCHKEYCELAKHILSLGEFKDIATLLDIISELV